MTPPDPTAPAERAAGTPPQRVGWPSAARERAFHAWLDAVAARDGLDVASLRVASADASFRRYLRVNRRPTHDDAATSRIVMDAPPEHENSEPFVRVARLMHDAGLNAPRVLEADLEHGFLLLTDLGERTMMDVLDPAHPARALPLYEAALDALIDWQLASKPGVLPPYDDALLRRELALFPDWYVARHRRIELDAAQRETLARVFDLIVRENLVAPNVFVHRDFMPRNLMMPRVRDDGSGGARLGVLDFQDAVFGPVTYDIASLMRDAFISWDEDFVLDVTVRYWQRAKQAALLGPLSAHGWGGDFGEFYRAVEWMGLQRHLKVAGIFARLTLSDGKPKYLADAPRFIGYIRATAGRYRELAPLVKLIDRIEGSSAATGYAFGRL